MFCIYCGSKLEPGFRFCMNCGKPVADLSAPAAPVQPVVPLQSQQPEAAEERVPQPEPAVEEPVEEVLNPSEEALPVQEAAEAPGEPAQEPEEIPQAPAQEPVPPVPPVQAPAYQQPVYQQPVQQPYYQPVYQPQYQQPVQEPVKAKKEKGKKEKKPAPTNRGFGARRGFGLGLLAWILCILIFVVSIPQVALVSLRYLTSEEGMLRTAQGIDLAELDAATFVTNVEPGEMTALEYFAHEAKVRGWDISDGDMEEIFRESDLLPFFVKQLSGFLNNIYTGEDAHELTQKDLSEFIKDNKDLLYDLTGQRLSNSDCSELARELLADMDLEQLSVEVLEDELGEVYSLIRFGLSWWMVAAFAVVIFLLALLLHLVNRRSLIRTNRDLGIVYLVLGGLLALPGLAYRFLPELWGKLFGDYAVLAVLTGEFLKALLLVSLAVVALGVVLILLSLFSRVCYRIRYAKPASGE